MSSFAIKYPFFILMMCLFVVVVGLNLGGNSINTMVLGGLALALSRLIDNSVVVLENICRHMEMGESPTEAAVKGGKEVQLAVLAATSSTCIVFFTGHPGWLDSVGSCHGLSGPNSISAHSSQRRALHSGR